jgi:glycosyltransferase involved in cell wall biosynthesis
LDWDEYGKPDFNTSRKYYHFLGNAAWRVKNINGAVHVIRLTRQERLKVLGGYRFNFRMGLRFTLSPRVSFCGLVGGETKNELLRRSKGLLFPVRWHEPFGLALIESLYFGCPVYGTPYGSLPELIPPEVGFLSNKVEELAYAMENNSCFSPKRCHDYVVEEFNSRKLAVSYLLLYEKVLNGEMLNPTKPRLVQKQEEKFLHWS